MHSERNECCHHEESRWNRDDVVIPEVTEASDLPCECLNGDVQGLPRFARNDI